VPHSRIEKMLLGLILLALAIFWYINSPKIKTTPTIRSEKILINFAPREELRSLPGIGEVTVEKILSQRRERLFQDFDDFISRTYKTSPEARPRKLMPTISAELIREYLDFTKKPPRNDEPATVF
jgi:hypothetical protein